MKWKYVMLSVLCVLIMSVSSVYAADINLEGLSVEELVQLKDEINEKIAELGGNNVIPSGNYLVGKDIRPGKFQLTITKDCKNSSIHDNEGYMDLDVWPTLEDYQQNNYKSKLSGAELYYDFSTDTPGTPFLVNLEEGNYLVIWNGSAIIDEITDASWAP